MADFYGQFDNAISGGSDVWDDGLAGTLLLQDYFAADLPPAVTRYAGPSVRATRYLGARTDETLYLGSGALFP